MALSDHSEHWLGPQTRADCPANTRNADNAAIVTGYKPRRNLESAWNYE